MSSALLRAGSRIGLTPQGRGDPKRRPRVATANVSLSQEVVQEPRRPTQIRVMLGALVLPVDRGTLSEKTRRKKNAARDAPAAFGTTRILAGYLSQRNQNMC